VLSSTWMTHITRTARSVSWVAGMTPLPVGYTVCTRGVSYRGCVLDSHKNGYIKHITADDDGVSTPHLPTDRFKHADTRCDLAPSVALLSEEQ
jgi:hypothetical protein